MTMTQQMSRKGFTLIELILVIVILGIVSSIGAEIIANIYSSYIIQRAQERASAKTELAATQIANRLTYAIPGTVFRRSSLTPNMPEEINSGLAQNPDTYSVIQWVGYDVDSFNAISAASNLPGWSGFCDLNASAGATVSTPGSNLGLANTIIQNLSKDTAGNPLLNITNAFVYFTGYENNPSAINNAAGSTITLATIPTRKVEQYKLAWTSYALVVAPSGGTNNLYLYHNFSPVPGTPIPAPTAENSSLLLNNVTSFKFRGDGQTIRFKICKSEDIGEANVDVTSCKEKAVY